MSNDPTESLDNLARLAGLAASQIRNYDLAPFACSTHLSRVIPDLLAAMDRCRAGLAEDGPPSALTPADSRAASAHARARAAVEATAPRPVSSAPNPPGRVPDPGDVVEAVYVTPDGRTADVLFRSGKLLVAPLDDPPPPEPAPRPVLRPEVIRKTLFPDPRLTASPERVDQMPPKIVPPPAYPPPHHKGSAPVWPGALAVAVVAAAFAAAALLVILGGP